MSSCAVFCSLNITSFSIKFTAVALYATMVYFFIKYGVTKLKRMAIIVFIVVSWTVTLSLATVPYFLTSDFVNDSGFCYVLPSSSSVVVSVVTSDRLSIACFSLCAILLFSILTYCYTKKNVISSDTNGSSDAKQAVVRNLKYLALVSAISLYFNATSAIYPFVRLRVFSANNGVVLTLVLSSVFGIFLDLLSAATPMCPQTCSCCNQGHIQESLFLLQEKCSSTSRKLI